MSYQPYEEDGFVFLQGQNPELNQPIFSATEEEVELEERVRLVAETNLPFRGWQIVEARENQGPRAFEGILTVIEARDTERLREEMREGEEIAAFIIRCLVCSLSAMALLYLNKCFK
ncbi:MAG: hypothetical protein ACOYK9_06745 [Chlamydiia bacterium]